MSYPNGWHPSHGWQPPPPYPPPATTHQDTADLRERLARLETGQHHMQDWLRHVAEQVTAHDDRLRKIGSRAGQTADTVAQHTATLTKLDGLPSALERAEAERKFRLDVLRYAAAGAIVIAVALSKGDLSQVGQIVGLLLGKGAVP
jgi:hypothetical protein